MLHAVLRVKFLPQLINQLINFANYFHDMIGSPSEALHFYANVGSPLPSHTNPADFFIQTLAIVPGNEEKCLQCINDIVDKVWMNVKKNPIIN